MTSSKSSSPSSSPAAAGSYRAFGVIDTPVPDLPGYIRDSWRWSDPEALRYALDQARQSRGQADAISRSTSVPGLLSIAFGKKTPPVLAPVKGLLSAMGPWPAAVSQLNGWERARAHRAIGQLSARLRELGEQAN